MAAADGGVTLAFSPFAYWAVMERPLRAVEYTQPGLMDANTPHAWTEFLVIDLLSDNRPAPAQTSAVPACGQIFPFRNH
jgi:hypothetical protein